MRPSWGSLGGLLGCCRPPPDSPPYPFPWELAALQTPRFILRGRIRTIVPKLHNDPGELPPPSVLGGLGEERKPPPPAKATKMYI